MKLILLVLEENHDTKFFIYITVVSCGISIYCLCEFKLKLLGNVNCNETLIQLRDAGLSLSHSAEE